MRINTDTYLKLQQIAEETNESKQDIIARAIDKFARELFLKKANEAYSLLRQSPKEWKELIEEEKEWDVTLADGLDLYE